MAGSGKGRKKRVDNRKGPGKANPFPKARRQSFLSRAVSGVRRLFGR